jgi:hypothetical protein
MQYIINYENNKYWATVHHTESPDPKILALTPVWVLGPQSRNQTIHYHFISKGKYVDMAEYYRTSAIKDGLFVSLQEKLKKQPGIDKMAGAIYVHFFGGYPHYVNFEPMEFTFSQLYDAVKDLHDSKHVDKAIINVWGAYQNRPPIHLPYNVKAGGLEKLKRVYDLAKRYGYLITNYHSWHALLQNDENYNSDWVRRDAMGRNLGDFGDFAAIMTIVVLNALLGFRQEYRAERAMAALRRLALPARRRRLRPVRHRLAGHGAAGRQERRPRGAQAADCRCRALRQVLLPVRPPRRRHTAEPQERLRLSAGQRPDLRHGRRRPAGPPGLRRVRGAGSPRRGRLAARLPAGPRG